MKEMKGVHNSIGEGKKKKLWLAPVRLYLGLFWRSVCNITIGHSF